MVTYIKYEALSCDYMFNKKDKNYAVKAFAGRAPSVKILFQRLNALCNNILISRYSSNYLSKTRFLSKITRTATGFTVYTRNKCDMHVKFSWQHIS